MPIDYYSREKCKHCGTCLSRCPVLRVNPAIAGRLVRRLADGEHVGLVLDACTGCMSCDAFCPDDAHPYGLLLERYEERYLASGIPRVFCNAMPQRDGPNLWSGLGKWLSASEKEDLESWSRPPGSEEVLFLGCNQRLTPYIAHTPLLKGLAVFSDPAQCCGEYYLRLGLIDEGRARATSLARRFAELGIKKVVAFCPACQNTIGHLAPDILGVDFNVEVTGLVDWLCGKVADGDITLTRELAGTVTVQDPCHASGIGEATIGAVRELLRTMGLQVIEMETTGLEAECCGLGASLARYNLIDVLRTGVRKSSQARRTGADRTCAWCNGCYMVMNMFRMVYPVQPPVWHLIELLEQATGEEPVRKQPVRSVQLLASAVEAAARDRFRFGRIHV